MPHTLPRRTLPIFLLLFAAAFVSAQTLEHRPAPQATTDAPTGRWITTHISSGGIGSWWDFRRDGTIAMYIGAAVTAKVTHTADTVTVPSGTPEGGTIVLDYKITGNILNLKRPGDHDTLFTREGPAPKPSDPLLGRWRPNPPATYSPNAGFAARQRAMTLGVYVFNPDGTQTVRIPFTSRNGTWETTTHTFKLEGDPRAYHFTRTPDRLKIGLPPDETRTDTLVTDTLFRQ